VRGRQAYRRHAAMSSRSRQPRRFTRDNAAAGRAVRGLAGSPSGRFAGSRWARGMPRDRGIARAAYQHAEHDEVEAQRRGHDEVEVVRRDRRYRSARRDRAGALSRALATASTIGDAQLRWPTCSPANAARGQRPAIRRSDRVRAGCGPQAPATASQVPFDPELAPRGPRTAGGRWAEKPPVASAIEAICQLALPVPGHEAMGRQQHERACDHRWLSGLLVRGDIAGYRRWRDHAAGHDHAVRCVSGTQNDGAVASAAPAG